DCRTLPLTAKQDGIDKFLLEDRRKGFDPAHVPMMRLTLFRTEDEAYTFVWSNHHILMDGWSSVLVMKEALAFYEFLQSGRSLVLPPARPFREYVAWIERQNLEGAERSEEHTSELQSRFD